MEKAEVLELIERVLSAMVEQQKLKALRMAQQLEPRLTSEDLLNPDNFPKLIQSPQFTYEDGLAAGILAAKIALRSEFA